MSLRFKDGDKVVYIETGGGPLDKYVGKELTVLKAGPFKAEERCVVEIAGHTCGFVAGEDCDYLIMVSRDEVSVNVCGANDNQLAPRNEVSSDEIC